MALPSPPSPDEPLGRYLPEESYFHRTKKVVKPRAFMPPVDLCLSVFRIDGLTSGEVWQIGQSQVIDLMPTRKELYGLAEIAVSEVREVELDIDADDNPPRHANVVGWPPEKAKQKLIAIVLAARARLVLQT